MMKYYWLQNRISRSMGVSKSLIFEKVSTHSILYQNAAIHESFGSKMAVLQVRNYLFYPFNGS